MTRTALLLMILLLPLSASAQLAPGNFIEIRDDTVFQGKAKVLDCGSGIACTVSGIIATITGSGGSFAPIAATYWTGSADATLTNEINLGALGTGLVINTTGTPSIYAGVTCTNQVLRALTASGGGTCVTIDSTYTTGTFPASAHNLLSASHGDTLAASVVRGDVLRGNSTPAWSRLALGGSNLYLKSNGADLLYSTLAAGGVGTCTNQFVSALNADAAPTCTTATLASAQFANQGTTTTVLHGNAAGNPSFAAVDLSADTTGTVPNTKGGTGQNSSGWSALALVTAGTWGQYAGVTCTNQVLTALTASAAGTCTTITSAYVDSTIVPSSRTISTVAPLSGGGDLSANRTLTTSMATNKLIGRGTAGTGVMEEITLGTNLSLSGTTLNAAGGGPGSANTVEVSVSLGTGKGLVYSTTVTGQAWVTPSSVVACSPFGTTADGQTVETVAASGVQALVSNRVVGTGFNLNVYSPHGASGTYRFHCTGA